MKTCDACSTEVTPGDEVLVPKLPKGCYRFHSSRRACLTSALRRAATVFPNVSGKRGVRVSRRPVS